MVFCNNFKSRDTKRGVSNSVYTRDCKGKIDGGHKNSGKDDTGDDGQTANGKPKKDRDNE
jgi:hypothetical protein